MRKPAEESSASGAQGAGALVKQKHIDICLNERVESRSITSGFERYHLVHQALPEIDLEDVDLRCDFLGHALDYPLIISAITGGTPLAQRINQNLATVAQSRNIAMMVGSERALLRDPSSLDTYAVRDCAPDILLLANLGAHDLISELSVDDCRRAVAALGANGLALYLNPLQQCFKPGCQPRFRGLSSRIEQLASELGYPVIVKEVGHGISGQVARKLREAGVAAVDIAGAGGTSWSIVEHTLNGTTALSTEAFDSWGIPTAEAVRDVRKAAPDLPIIASGGIRNGVEIAKAIALGANLAGMALPLLRPAVQSADAVDEILARLINELRAAMFCVGAANLRELSSVPLVCESDRMWQTARGAKQQW